MREKAQGLSGKGSLEVLGAGVIVTEPKTKIKGGNIVVKRMGLEVRQAQVNLILLLTNHLSSLGQVIQVSSSINEDNIST